MYSIPLLSLSVCVVAEPGSTVPGHAHDGPLPDEKAMDLEDFGAQENHLINRMAKRKPSSSSQSLVYNFSSMTSDEGDATCLLKQQNLH